MNAQRIIGALRTSEHERFVLAVLREYWRVAEVPTTEQVFTAMTCYTAPEVETLLLSLSLLGLVELVEHPAPTPNRWLLTKLGREHH